MPYFTPYFLHGKRNKSKKELYISMEDWIKTPNEAKDFIKDSGNIDFSREEN